MESLTGSAPAPQAATPSGVGPGVGSNHSQGSPQAQAPTAPQTTTPPADTGAKVELTELPEFRQWQSKYDQRMSKLQQDSQQRLKQQQQHFQQQLDSLKQFATEHAPSSAQNEFKLAQALQERDFYQTQIEEMQQNFARQQQLSEIATQYGMQYEDLADAESPLTAYERVAQNAYSEKSELMKRIEALEAQLSGKQAAQVDAPDLGGGAPAQGGDFQKQYDAAVRSLDSMAAEQVKEQARASGIQLDLNPRRFVNV